MSGWAPRWRRTKWAVALLLCAGAASASPVAAEPPPEVITIGTGSPVGVYFIAGNALCRIVAKAAANARPNGQGSPARCVAAPSAGSNENLARLAAGSMTFAIVQSDSHYHAARGDTPEAIPPNDKLRAVMALHPEAVHLVVAKDGGIGGVADLKGKRVNVGEPGSGSSATARMLLAAHGLAESDLKEAARLSPLAQSAALCEGAIDAFVYTVGVPNSSVALATDGCDARLVPLNGPVEAKLVRDKPYYVAVTIAEGTYHTSERDLMTFGPIATLVTSADTDEATVHDLTRSVMENLDALRAAHPAFATLTPRRMIKEGLTAPLHPGAARYYRERGWLPPLAKGPAARPAP